MSLPDLALQIIYGRLAWALVAAAVLLALLPVALPKLIPAPRRRTIALTVAAMAALMALPGAASPAYSLILVFQYPSGLLLGCCMVSLWTRWQGKPVRFALRPGLALALTLAGLVLYLDAFGVLALGWYYGGFSAVGAPLLACAVAAACAVAIVRGRAAGSAGALLIAVMLFSLLRLPTGNLWDALLDPLLWAWAAGSAIAAFARRQSLRKLAALPPLLEPAPVFASEADAELVPVHASGVDKQL
ncbi:hypothetical protein [Duganella aceris]|uniref:Uncharacterized protein n=1 Tax=Duganella aceris TaxID=2703883 RepID=A0ABX0FL74_9BURK|nr:hypothetical protein [Duganella aceris]NGZ85289.1 hypothetical protein [Duganella aceris]